MEHDIFPRVHYKDPDKYVYGDMPLCLYLYIYINYLYYVQTWRIYSGLFHNVSVIHDGKKMRYLLLNAVFKPYMQITGRNWLKRWGYSTDRALTYWL